MTLFTRLKQLVEARDPNAPEPPHSPLAIVDEEIALSRARLEDGAAVLETLEQRAMDAVQAGRDEIARRVLAEVASVQEFLQAEEAALSAFEAQRANLRLSLVRP